MKAGAPRAAPRASPDLRRTRARLQAILQWCKASVTRSTDKVYSIEGCDLHPVVGIACEPSAPPVFHEAVLVVRRLRTLVRSRPAEALPHIARLFQVVRSDTSGRQTAKETFCEAFRLCLGVFPATEAEVDLLWEELARGRAGANFEKLPAVLGKGLNPRRRRAVAVCSTISTALAKVRSS